jgi:hypothetical protein
VCRRCPAAEPAGNAATRGKHHLPIACVGLQCIAPDRQSARQSGKPDRAKVLYATGVAERVRGCPVPQPPPAAGSGPAPAHRITSSRPEALRCRNSRAATAAVHQTCQYRCVLPVQFFHRAACDASNLMPSIHAVPLHVFRRTKPGVRAPELVATVSQMRARAGVSLPTLQHCCDTAAGR